AAADRGPVTGPRRGACPRTRGDAVQARPGSARMSTTRRAFLGGAAASAMLPAVARAGAPPGSLEAVGRVVPRARALAVAVGRYGTAWIALNGADRIVGVDVATAKVVRTLRTPALPDRVAVSPDGRRLLVSHGGLDSEHVSVIEIATRHVHRYKAGRLPS